MPRGGSRQRDRSDHRAPSAQRPATARSPRRARGDRRPARRAPARPARAKLYVDEQVVAEGSLKTQPGHFALCGEGLSIGRDSGDPVSKEYPAGFAFQGGTILEVEVNIGDDVYLDVEREFAAALARD